MCILFQSSFQMLVLLGLVVTSVLVHAQEDDQSGFISIDCGIAKGSTYTDYITGINYVSDDEFRNSGEIHNIQAIHNLPGLDKQLTTLTSFPKNTRNCYTLRPSQGKGNRYLIRASFLYGNYDFKGKIPKFDVYLGHDYWDTVTIESVDQQRKMEIIHVPSSDYIHVCLVDTGGGTPFISAIELRLLASNMYGETSLGSLHLFDREDFNINSEIIRYKDDKYDRRWLSTPQTDDLFTSLSTPDEVSAGVFDIPSKVMSSAVAPISNSLVLPWHPANTSDEFFIYLHFAEIGLLNSTQTRKMNIYLNDEFWSGPFTPLDHTTSTTCSTTPETAAPSYRLVINKTEDSTLPPIINAYELYVLKKFEQRHTDDQDAAAIWSIKSIYRVTRNWQGDPCGPQEFVWDGLICSFYSDTNSFRITSLNLTTSGLNGEIDPGLANLTMIETMDLSNNNLTGTVPNFLSGLKFLKVLNLTGNNFVGPVPEELLAKAKHGSLLMSIDVESTGDTGSSCGTNQCKRKKDNIIISLVIAAVASIFVIITALTVIWMIKKRKTHGMRNNVTERLNAEKKKTSMGLEIKKDKFTYSEVKTMTDNFKVVIGKGGFGEVYHGYIGDAQVAVKMLSESSLQGNKEFQAEAYLLLSVHHKNLTSLVGYCDEDNYKGIIYEYMANGNLERHLFDKNSSVLSWEERLRIGCDAAHGLEYLHHGCKPPIVHRDVKCNNILLNKTFQAKLADFGLSKAFPIEGGSHISTAVVGTPGYLDPEYYTSNRLTEKSDVYSFGTVLLVMITGQPAIIPHEKDTIHISRLVNIKVTDGDMKNIVDPRLLGDFDINSAWKAVELAMACVGNMPSKRPTMKEVVMELSDCLIMERARQETRPREFIGLSSINLESAYPPNPR